VCKLEHRVPNHPGCDAFMLCDIIKFKSNDKSSHSKKSFEPNSVIYFYTLFSSTQTLISRKKLNAHKNSVEIFKTHSIYCYGIIL